MLAEHVLPLARFASQGAVLKGQEPQEEMFQRWELGELLQPMTHYYSIIDSAVPAKTVPLQLLPR